MTTALELITASMRLATILASGETPTADEAVDGLKSLNDILEDWSTQKLAVYEQNNEQFALVVGTATYTIGPAGTFNTRRPIRIGQSFVRLNGADFPVTQWSLEEYNSVAVKTVGGIPERYVYLNDYPLGQIILYPVPAATSTLFLDTDVLLAFPLTLATVLSFPPGYEKALRFNLAMDLGPEYGVTPPAWVGAEAAKTLGNIKRANRRRVVSSYDSTLLGEPAFAYWQRGY